MLQNEEQPYALDVVSIRLVTDSQLCSGQPIRYAADAVRLVGDYLREMDREVVCVINLKADLSPINCTFASIGNLDTALVSPREIFKSSILSNAAKMMLMHNHPSGSLNPSLKDQETTIRMSKLCYFMGIPLLDHIIVAPGTEDYFSFQYHELMPDVGNFKIEDFEPSM